MKPVSELLRSRAGTLWHVRPDDRCSPRCNCWRNTRSARWW